MEEDGERRSRDKGREGERESGGAGFTCVCLRAKQCARGSESHRACSKLSLLPPQLLLAVGAPILHQTAAAACTKRGLAPATTDLHQSGKNFGQN